MDRREYMRQYMRAYRQQKPEVCRAMSAAWKKRNFARLREYEQRQYRRIKNMDMPQTLIEAVRYFSDLDRCEEYMRKLRWPDGKPECPECGSRKIGEIKTRRLLRCKECRRQIYTKRGTIFEASPLGLDKWFVAVWCVANCKNGISSHELARAIGVQQKSAWFMLHRIRTAMEIDDGPPFDGPAEVDTTYVGGKAANMHKSKREAKIKGRGSVGKTPVHGVLQRTIGGQPSQVRAIVLAREDAETLIGDVRRRVKAGAEVYTDEAMAYSGLVPSYERHGSDADRFAAVLSRVFGRRLTYRVLTGKDGAGFMGLE